MTHTVRDNAGFQIARLGPDDWQSCKALRLEALRLEPDAFSSTYEDAVSQPDEWWQARLAQPECTTLMARADGQPVGMATACRGEGRDDSGVGFIFGMYVNARHRRQGVGRALLHAGIDHLRSLPGVTTVRLWVTVTHDPARRLYEALGFKVIDEPNHPDPNKVLDGEYLMERPAQL